MAPDNTDSGSSTPSAGGPRTAFSKFAANPQRVKPVPHNFAPTDVPSEQAANDGDFRETDNYAARHQRPANSRNQDGDDDAEACAYFDPAQMPSMSTTKQATKTKTRRAKYSRVGRYALTDSSSLDTDDESSDDATRSQQTDRPEPSGVAASADGAQRQRVEQHFVVANPQRPNEAQTVASATTTASSNTGTIGFGSSARPTTGQSAAITSNEVSGTAATSQTASRLRTSRDSVADAEVERVMGQVGHGERFLRQSVQRSQQNQATDTTAQPARTASAASGRSSTSIFNRSGNNILKRLSFVDGASRAPGQQSAATSQRRPSSPRPTNDMAAASNESLEDDDDDDETGFENVPPDYRPASSMSSRPSSTMIRPRILPTFGEPVDLGDEGVTRTTRACAAPSTQADEGEDSDETGFEHAPPFKPKSDPRAQPTNSTATSGGRYGNVRADVNDGARPTRSDSNLQQTASTQRPHSVTTVHASVATPAEFIPRRSASQMQARLPSASFGNEKLEQYREIIRGILRLRHPDMMMVRDLEGVLQRMEVSRMDLQVRLGVPLREFLDTVPDVDLLVMGEHDYCVYLPPDNAL